MPSGPFDMEGTPDPRLASLPARALPIPSAPSGVELAAGIRGREVLGVDLALTDYEQTMDVMDGLVANGEKGYICAVAVHAVMVANNDPEMAAALADSTLTVPDGMPLVWAINLLGEQLHERVYGPELMQRYCERCVERGHRVWLYGGRDQ